MCNTFYTGLKRTALTINVLFDEDTLAANGHDVDALTLMRTTAPIVFGKGR